MADMERMTDSLGYRPREKPPTQNARAKKISGSVQEVWYCFSGSRSGLDFCLNNFYHTRSPMVVHQDRDEADFIKLVL